MSRAATRTGTRRRRAMELAAIDRLAKQVQPGLTGRARRAAVRTLHRRAVKASR